MKLTPLDIHHKEFRLALRGYNQEEVDQFLDEVADELERLFKENIDLKEKLDAATARVQEYVDMERTLHNTMVAAQTSADETKARATKEAYGLLHDAEIKAKELVQAALVDKQRLQADFLTLKEAEDGFRTSFRKVLEDHLRKLHELPVSPDVAAIVDERDAAAEADLVSAGFITDNSGDAADDAGLVQAAEPTPEAQPSRRPAAQVPSDDERPRTRSRAVAPTGEATQPIAAPAKSTSVQALTLGETAPPDLEDGIPSLEEPAEFPVSRFRGAGERDDDLDIEQID